ncbi:hypothetical protein E2562_007849 [Oryza meyeriana var. granulata]|uniref:Uncharacterized protein n=1 Tax=Oryza meyeriana var. granulata TaxID=110450 RepID=A0A6G1F5A1_9ORYZ|nr:hypothetical protein E2562_007849 [Oryza meyeriana var. granulata]
MGSTTGGVGGAMEGKLPAVRLRRVQWTMVDERCELQEEKMEYVRWFHRHEPRGNQSGPYLGRFNNYSSILTVHFEVIDG